MEAVATCQAAWGQRRGCILRARRGTLLRESPRSWLVHRRSRCSSCEYEWCCRCSFPKHSPSSLCRCCSPRRRCWPVVPDLRGPLEKRCPFVATWTPKELAWRFTAATKETSPWAEHFQLPSERTSTSPGGYRWLRDGDWARVMPSMSFKMLSCVTMRSMSTPMRAEMLRSSA